VPSRAEILQRVFSSQVLPAAVYKVIVGACGDKVVDGDEEDETVFPVARLDDERAAIGGTAMIPRKDKVLAEIVGEDFGSLSGALVVAADFDDAVRMSHGSVCSRRLTHVDIDAIRKGAMEEGAFDVPMLNV
jgi:hypothetical protein